MTLAVAITFALPLAAADEVSVSLIGPPASGKTTYGADLASGRGVPLIGAEEALRQALKSVGKDDGDARDSLRRALKAVRAGEPADEAALESAFASRLAQNDCAQGFVLDGFPETVRQAKWLTGWLEGVGKRPVTVVLLELSDGVALFRLRQRGRADDWRGQSEERLRRFRADSQPLLAYYEERGVLRRVDATQSPSEIRAALDSILSP